MTASDITLWGFVVMATVSLVGGWFAHRVLKRSERKENMGAPGGITKISANLPDDAVETLKKLAAKRGTTLTDVLLRAIGTEAYLDQARTEGCKVLLEDSKGKIKELVFNR